MIYKSTSFPRVAEALAESQGVVMFIRLYLKLIGIVERWNNGETIDSRESIFQYSNNPYFLFFWILWAYFKATFFGVDSLLKIIIALSPEVILNFLPLKALSNKFPGFAVQLSGQVYSHQVE